MARPRGRAPATRGVYAIEDAGLLLPTAVALDTSFDVHAVIESQSLHGPCAAFLERLVASDVTVVVSELLEVELAEIAFRIALTERWGRAWRRHRTDGRARRRARRLFADVHGRYELTLGAAFGAPIPLGRVSVGAATLMADHGIASYDAVHAATAIAAGAEASIPRNRPRSRSERIRSWRSGIMSCSRPRAAAMRARSPIDATSVRRPRPSGSRLAARRRSRGRTH